MWIQIINVAVFLRIVYFVNIVMSALSSVRAGATVHAGWGNPHVSSRGIPPTVIESVFIWMLFVTVAHGAEEQRRNLDSKTRESLDTNSQEYKDAQIELFGRELEANDWDGMEEEERDENTKKLMARLKEKRDARLNETGT